MTRSIFFLRHARTSWNVAKRIQGRTDIAVLPESLAALKRCSVPATLHGANWFCSPLLRARQTAAALGVSAFTIEVALVEMHWGDWEGRTLRELREQGGDAMRLNEARGLDMRPPNGESPRDVGARVADWMRQYAAGPGRNAVAVTHKGVIRATFARTWAWDMCTSPPHKLDWDCAHELVVDDDGAVRSGRLNIPLTQSQPT